MTRSNNPAFAAKMQERFPCSRMSAVLSRVPKNAFPDLPLVQLNIKIRNGPSLEHNIRKRNSLGGSRKLFTLTLHHPHSDQRLEKSTTRLMLSGFQRYVRHPRTTLSNRFQLPLLNETDRQLSDTDLAIGSSQVR